MPSLDAIIWTAIGVTAALAVIGCLRILACEIDNGVRRQRLAVEAVRVQQQQMKRLRQLRSAADGRSDATPAADGAEAYDVDVIEEPVEVGEAA